MGDFASPAAVPTGGGICINNSNVNLNSAINATNSSTGGGGNVGIPKHSTVVERLRQRIEGCRRHHVNCESRYQQAHAEQLELDRRETLSLYQRSLEQRAKKSSNSKQQSKQQEPDSTATTEQRSSTLIAVSSALPIVCVTVLLNVSAVFEMNTVRFVWVAVLTSLGACVFTLVGTETSELVQL
ncbi:Mastermind-like protein 3 [Labeo rohita]|uniref:Mastermind-like protein 3 n=1 Tax=Labeo rohita TaxID=84645 RepID=A0ABQ8LA43_LABRO|nr:Mastermind-like protein 3 [Labeo rohita]